MGKATQINEIITATPARAVQYNGELDINKQWPQMRREY